MKFLLYISAIALISTQSIEAWHSNELTIIKRGYEANEIAYSPSHTVGGPGTFENPAEGPHMAVVDNAENIIIISSQNYQFKGFDSVGKLLFDFSRGTPGYNPQFYDETPWKIYVDSEMRIYVQSDLGTGYVPVIDYNGEMLEKIRPFPEDLTALIQAMNWAPDGTLFFFNKSYGWVTYIDGSSIPGGTTGFKANNGSYYAVHKKTASSIEIRRYEHPVKNGLAESRELTEVPIEVDTLIGADLINGGDGNSLYVILAINDFFNFEIWQFDLDYNVIDKLTLTNEEAYGDLRIAPFIRSDGNFYEFLFREDGLHVIRWSKD